MISKKYLITDITYKNGKTRTDWKYPNRIGSTVELKSNLIIGNPLYFQYMKYNNGKLVENHLTRTSIVNDYDTYSKPGFLVIFTRNSIYYFKELEE